MAHAADEAVSSTVGTVLMLAITITVFAGISVGVLSYFEAGPDPPRAELDVVETSTGYLLVHKGGEAVRLDGSVIVNIGGTAETIPLSTFAAAGYLGAETWGIGRSICLAGPSTATRTCYIDTATDDPDVRGVMVVVDGVAIAFNGVLSGGSPRGSCVSDSQAPTVQTWLQDPLDVATDTSGGVTVTVTLADNCVGADGTSPPHLLWRINDGSNPAYTDAGAATAGALDEWVATIPAQDWAGSSGTTLEYYMGPLRDLNGNTANSATQSDVIEVPGTVYSYVSSAAMTVGSVSSFFNAQSASDGDSSAALTEGLLTTTVQADGVDAAETDSSWISPVLAAGSDDQWATQATQSDALQMTMAAPPATGGAITKMQLNAEVSILGLSGSDGFTLAACFASTCGTASATLSPSDSDTLIAYDATLARPGGGSWTWDDLAALEVRVTTIRSNPSGETWRVDDVSATVTYAPVSTTMSSDGVSSFVSWSDPANARVTDNAYATYDIDTTSPAYLQVTNADPSTSAGTITAVVLKAEVSVTGRVDDGFTLQACIIATCSTASSALAASSTDSVISYDISAQRPGGGSWSWTDIAGLESRITPVRVGGMDGVWRVDGAWVEVTSSVTVSAGGVTTAGSWSNRNNAFASDNSYAQTNQNSPSYLQLSYDNPSTLTGSLQSIVIAAEVSVSGHVDDTFTIAACSSATLCSAASPAGGGSLTDVAMTWDVTGLRPGGGTWTATDITSLDIRVNAQQNGGGRDGIWLLDHAYLTVTLLDTLMANGEASAISWSGWSKAAASDNQYAAYSRDEATPAYIQFTLPSPGTTSYPVTQVVLKAELVIAGQTNDDMTIQACFGLTCSAASAELGVTGIDTTFSYDVTSLRPGGGSWSWNDLQSLEVRVNPILRTARDGTWQVDRAWVEVSSPAYTLDGQLLFSGVPAGATHGLSLAYRTTGDTFTVQVWDGSAWTTRGAALDSATFVPWSYALTAAEYNGGAPRVRFLDATPSSPSQGQLYIDYARVSTP